MLNNSTIDNLAKQLTLGSTPAKTQAFLQIWQIAKECGTTPASIHDLYINKASGVVPTDFTVPAINVRGMTYDIARTIFKIALTKNVGTIIFELARSEMGYTNQSPHEYAGVILAAAIREQYHYPVFIQGDHFHFKIPDQTTTFESELEDIKKLSLEAIDAGFYNIDIDASTLVDYSQNTIDQQQEPNYLATAVMADFIRQHQPSGLQISLGGEIGHIGGKNSTIDELQAFDKGFKQNLEPGKTGLSKISIQTGTHHGGVVLADGSLAEVNVDFNTLKTLSAEARNLGMGGAVQHGASTLPEQYFSQFPKAKTLEIHLATEFQNIIFDHPAFPADLLGTMYHWLDENKAPEKKPDQTKKQFYYQMRKTTWGAFKKELWDLPTGNKDQILQSISEKIEFLFKALNIENTRKIVDKVIKPVMAEKTEIKQVKNWDKIEFSAKDPE